MSLKVASGICAMPKSTNSEEPLATTPMPPSNEEAATAPPASGGKTSAPPSNKEKLLELAQEYKRVGNVLFQESKFSEAVTAYSRAIVACESCEDEEEDTSPIPSTELSASDSLLAVCLSNRAICQLKLENFGSVIMDADRALEINPSFAKAYYRRGCGYVALSRFLEALKDFQKAHQLQPNNSDTASKIKICQKEIRSQKFAAAIRSTRTQPVSELVDLKKLEIGIENYSGPRFSKDPKFLADLIDYIKVPGNVLHKHDAYEIVLEILSLLKSLPTLVDITIPENDHFTVCGDIHGQYYDLLNIFEMNGLPSQTNPYLFNGDFVDRGSFSVECILTLFAAKLLYPNHVHLARGNHETRSMNQLYGFHGEIIAKYDEQLYELCSEVFCWLPLAHVINKKVLVVHGGLFAKDNVTLKDIEKIQRNLQPPDEGLMTELLWSDPQPQKGRSPSKRGVACAFGPDVTENFLMQNKLDYIIRSHEMKLAGYELEHNDKVITVFSAPNYCDQMGNKGAFIRLVGKGSGSLSKPEFVTFDAVSHPTVPAMKYANSLFSMF